MLSLKDILKKSFLEGYASSDISLKTVIIALCIAAVISVYIFFVYRVITRKTFYSKNFNISLVCVALITTTIIITIQSSVVVSLGMVGALSIVRFRTAVKDPMDLAFMFWSISTGIICGAGFSEFAIVLAVVMTVAIFILNRFPVAKAPMILVINASNIDIEKAILEVVTKYAKHYNIKSRNMTSSKLDMIIELRTSEGSELVRNLMEVQGVVSASLMQHDGEATY